VTLGELIESVEGLLRERTSRRVDVADDLYDEVLQYARVRLVEAAPKYDEGRARWSTFARTVIDRAVVDALRRYNRRRPTADMASVEAARAAEGREFAGIDVGELIEDTAIPRLYRRALRAGSVAAFYPKSGLKRAETRRIFACSLYHVRRKVNDLP
jgi:DNA-directed RNA polymerase specialized sigma24 family protein